MNCRYLAWDDYQKGYFDLLSQLTHTPTLHYERFLEIHKKITSNKNHHILVLEDTESQKIIGTGTVFIEQKFIRGGQCVGHIEDIVVDNSFRGQGFGKLLIETLIQICKDNNCYKVLLDCSPENTEFYKKVGLSDSKSVNMMLYF
jgi:glucosamine-phosphate N-acetyltransferase